MTVPTQAQIVRAVKAALRPAQEMGLTVTGYRVTWTDGVPCVAVDTAPESPQPKTVGGYNVKELTDAIRNRHAPRRP